jgi:hypothetical protein
MPRQPPRVARDAPFMRLEPPVDLDVRDHAKGQRIPLSPNGLDNVRAPEPRPELTSQKRHPSPHVAPPSGPRRSVIRIRQPHPLHRLTVGFDQQTHDARVPRPHVERTRAENDPSRGDDDTVGTFDRNADHHSLRRSNPHESLMPIAYGEIPLPLYPIRLRPKVVQLREWHGHRPSAN